MQGIGALAVTAALPGGVEAQQRRPENRESAPAPRNDISQLRERFPRLAEKWERIPGHLRSAPWSHSVTERNKLGERAEVKEFLNELHGALRNSMRFDHFGKTYDVHDLAFAQIGGRSGYMLRMGQRDVLSQTARAGAEAGISFGTQAEQEAPQLRELLRLRSRESKENLPQLTQAYAELAVGPFREQVGKEWVDYTGLKQTKRLVVTTSRRMQGGGEVEVVRALTETELKKYVETGEPVMAKIQFLHEEDGKSEWLDDEDALVPRDLTYDPSRNEVVPYAFTEKFRDRPQKERGLSASLALTVAYLQYRLHEHARNIPSNRGAGWEVTGNISTPFLNNLPLALGLAADGSAGKDQERLEYTVAEQIVLKEILPTIRGITLGEIRRPEDLFEPLADYVKLEMEKPVRDDFETEILRYDYNRLKPIEGMSLWYTLADEAERASDKNTVPDELQFFLQAHPKGEYNKFANIKAEPIEVEIPSHVRLLVQEQRRHIGDYEEKKNSILNASRQLNREKLGQITVKQGGSIVLESTLPMEKRTLLRGAPLRASATYDRFFADERSWGEWWQQKEQSNYFNFNDNGTVQVSPDTPKGIHQLHVSFTAELPEPPLGAPGYSAYHDADRPRHRATSFGATLLVRVQ